jgi:3-oxoacyl-[acyl-carrier protein] reductase
VLLKDKVAVIYRAGGAVGGAVARTFAREGANVFVSRRTLAPVARLAREITSAGGVAEAAAVDALNEEAVDNYVGAVTGRDRAKLETAAEAIGENVLPVRARVNITAVLSPNGRADTAEVTTRRREER